jgi:hypothetical protein
MVGDLRVEDADDKGVRDCRALDAGEVVQHAPELLGQPGVRALLDAVSCPLDRRGVRARRAALDDQIELPGLLVEARQGRVGPSGRLHRCADDAGGQARDEGEEHRRPPVATPGAPNEDRHGPQRATPPLGSPVRPNDPSVGSARAGRNRAPHHHGRGVSTP